MSNSNSNQTSDTNVLASRFGNLIFEKRKAFGMTQEKLAEEVDVDVKIIGHIERGESKNYITALKIVCMLGIPIDDELFPDNSNTEDCPYIDDEHSPDSSNTEDYPYTDDEPFPDSSNTENCPYNQKVATNFGKRVREKRGNNNMSKKALAKVVGISAKTVKRIELGKNKCYVTALKIAYILEISIDDELFGGTDIKDTNDKKISELKAENDRLKAEIVMLEEEITYLKKHISNLAK